MSRKAFALSHNNDARDADMDYEYEPKKVKALKETRRHEVKEKENRFEEEQVEPKRKNAKTITTTSSISSETDLKRQLADAEKRLAKITKAHADLEYRYDELKNLRETTAERNLRDYESASEKRSRASEKLITQLEEQLELYTSDPSSKPIKRVDSAEEKAKDNLISELKIKVRTLERDLSAEIENSKSLSSRLAKSSRGQTSAPEPSEPSNSTRQSLELYEELTGMLIRKVTVEEGETTLECLHSGKNGTLHFKLVQVQSQPNLLHYKPLLDENRDRALIQLLPEYLTDDISFKKDVAQLFFWRVLNFLVEEQ